jgi:hypothetical protein
MQFTLWYRQSQGVAHSHPFSSSHVFLDPARVLQLLPVGQPSLSQQ